MTEHLPECRLSEPCDINIAEHGFYPMQVGKEFFCIYCMGDCICERLRALQSEQQTSELQGKWDAVIAAIEAMPTIEDLDGDTYLDLTVPEILAALKAMP